MDPFVLPPQPQTFSAVLQQPDQNKVLSTSWVDDKMNLLRELPVQNRMVVPSECPGIQDPESLEPERLTHIFSEGRHRVIRDFWRDRHAKRATLLHRLLGMVLWCLLRGSMCQCLPMTPMPRPFKQINHQGWLFLHMCLMMFHRQQLPHHPVRTQHGPTAAS